MTRYSLRTDGCVTPCCIRADPDVINFGNVFEMPFEDVWNGKTIRKFRRDQVLNLFNPVCDSCPDLNLARIIPNSCEELTAAAQRFTS